MSRSRWKHSRSFPIRATLVSGCRVSRPALDRTGGMNVQSIPRLALHRQHRVACHTVRELGLPPSHPRPYAMVQTSASAQRSRGYSFINRMDFTWNLSASQRLGPENFDQQPCLRNKQSHTLLLAPVLCKTSPGRARTATLTTPNIHQGAPSPMWRFPGFPFRPVP